jgi:NDP-sugar pyrophosphorylase family protein
MILENFREEIPNEWSNAIKWFIKNLKSDNYKFTVHIVPWITNVLDSILETEPLSTLAAEGQLVAFRHEGFWQPMDTLRDKNHLEELWASGNAPWKIW